MAITETTLAGAVGVSDTSINLTSVTGVSAPTTTTGAGYTYLKIDEELLFVSGAPVGTLVPVLRGQGGSTVIAHATATPVLIGGPTDFASFKPNANAFQALGQVSVGAPLTGAVIMPVGGSVHHFTGTVAITSIVPPDTAVAWRITLIFDGSGAGLGWTGGSSANNPSVTGVVTAAQMVDFLYDPSTSLWYPSTIT